MFFSQVCVSSWTDLTFIKVGVLFSKTEQTIPPVLGGRASLPDTVSKVRRLEPSVEQEMAAMSSSSMSCPRCTVWNYTKWLKCMFSAFLVELIYKYIYTALVNNLLQAIHEGHTVPEEVVRAHLLPASAIYNLQPSFLPSLPASTYQRSHPISSQPPTTHSRS